MRRYNLTFHAYCGMAFPILERAEKDEVKAEIARRVKAARRKGQPVSRLSPGRWEFQSPDDAGSVSDDDGILSARRVPPTRRPFGRR